MRLIIAAASLIFVLSGSVWAQGAPGGGGSGGNVGRGTTMRAHMMKSSGGMRHHRMHRRHMRRGRMTR